MVEGSMLERVARSYHAVQEKSAAEHDTISKYYAAVSQIESLEKEAQGGAGNGIAFHLLSNSNAKVLILFLLIRSLIFESLAYSV